MWTQNKFKLAEYMTVEPVRPTAEAHDRPCGHEPEPIDIERLERLKESMRANWAAGLRYPRFHFAVRQDYPTATLAEFNEAAEAVWAEVGETPEAANFENP